MFRKSEKILYQIRAPGKQMRALEISNLTTQLEQLRASLTNENAGLFVLMLAIAQQVLPIKEAYVVPIPYPMRNAWGKWWLAPGAIFGIRP